MLESFKVLIVYKQQHPSSRAEEFSKSLLQFANSTSGDENKCDHPPQNCGMN